MKKTLKIFITVVVAVAIAAAGFLAGYLTSKFSRGREVRSFEWALDTIRENYYEDLPEDEMGLTSLKAIAEMLDPYSAYYTAEEYKALVASNGGAKSGIGVSYMYLPAGVHPHGKSGVLIEEVVGNSPAFYSGLKAGEFVSSGKAGEQTVEFTSSDAFGDFVDARATGEVFTIYTDRGEYQMSKQNYTSSYCRMSTATKSWNIVYEGSSGYVEWEEGGISCLPAGTAYLKLDQFYGNAANEMAGLIEEFNAEHCTSLILDLRGNGGGYVNVMCDISDIFTGELQNSNKIAMVAKYKSGRQEGFSVNDKFSGSEQLPAGTEVKVLADNGTASASEALIGVLVDNGVIGYGDIYLSDLSQNYLSYTGTADKNCRSYGKGIMQTTFENHTTHEALKLTTAKIYWPNGETCIHDVGLNLSMGCNSLATDWDVVYGDPQLQSLCRILGGAAL